METINAVCPRCHSVVRIPTGRLEERPGCPKCKSAVLSGEPVPLDRQSFAPHTERSDLPMLVDFWAPWCGPCRMMAPVLDRAAAELSSRLRVGKVNTDDEPELGGRFGIRSIPTLILFKHGRELARKSGAMDLGSLKRWLASAIG